MTTNKKKEIDIYSLEGIPGIGPIGQTRLSDNGINNYFDMVIRSYIEIADICNLDREKAAKAVSHCKQELQNSKMLEDSIRRGDEVYEDLKKHRHVSTGCKALDELLDGGIETENITEFAGRSTSGKTQISHVCAVNAQLPVEQGGLTEDPKRPATVIYIDTENTFSPNRIRDIVLGKKLATDEKQVKKFLNNIVVIRVQNAAHQITTLKNISQIITELNTKLIIIDSGTAFFRVDLIGMGNMGRRSQMLNDMSMTLKRLCQTYKLAGIFVNQVYTSPDPFDPGDKAVGGNIIAHTMSYRLMLRRKSKFWVATLYKSVKHDKDDCEYLVTSSGIEDK